MSAPAPSGRPRVRRRPTGVGVGVAVAAILSFGVSWASQAPWVGALAAGAVALLVASWSPPRRAVARLCLDVRAPVRATLGDPVDVGVRATGDRGGAAVLTERAFGLGRLTVPALDDGVAETVRVVAAERRGRVPVLRVEVTSAVPFGLIRARRFVAVEAGLTIVPRVVALAGLPLAGGGTERLRPAGAARPRRAHAGAPAGVRDHRPGDPLRSVHWRTSARRGELVVREWEDDDPLVGGPPVRLLIAGPAAVDPTRDGRGRSSAAYERLVSAAASLGARALDEGRPLVVVGAGPPFVPADRDELLDALAEVGHALSAHGVADVVREAAAAAAASASGGGGAAGAVEGERLLLAEDGAPALLRAIGLLGAGGPASVVLSVAEGSAPGPAAAAATAAGHRLVVLDGRRPLAQALAP